MSKQISKFIVLMMAILLLSISSSVQANGKPNTTIARVLDTHIYAHEVKPSKKLLERRGKEMTPKNLDQWIKDYIKQALFTRIIRDLQIDYIKKHNNEPTEAEVESFISFSQNARENELGKNQKQKKYLEDRLASSALTDRERKQSQEHLVIIGKSIEGIKRRQAQFSQIPNYKEIQRKALERVAKTSVWQWKYNQTLYRVYGGRVIFQQAGAEPIDAYIKVYKHWKETKAFEVFDPVYADIFKEFEQYLEMPHNYLPKEDGENYFSMPWWQQASP